MEIHLIHSQYTETYKNQNQNGKPNHCDVVGFCEQRISLMTKFGGHQLNTRNIAG